MWCKPGQYLDHKNCICKNKLIGRLIEECTSVINETMINNKDSGNNNNNNNDDNNNNNNMQNVFIGLFSVVIVYFNKTWLYRISILSFLIIITWNCLSLRVCLF